MSNQKSMICEMSSSYDNNSLVVESHVGKDGKDVCRLRGIVIQANHRNLNERVYPYEEIARAVNDLRAQLKAGKSILCEMDHPETMTINLDRVVGMIEDIWMEGNNGIASIKIIDTDKGKDIKQMLKAGVQLGVSSRGMGDVDEFSGHVSNFEIITIDIVATPSAPDAYPKAVFESLFHRRGHLIAENKIINTNEIQEKQKSQGTVDCNEILGFFKRL